MAICNNSIIDVSQERGTIYLGVWDTLNVKEQQFDISAWLNAFGDEGELLLLVQRNGDELPYSADNITLSGNILTWTFSETDTAKVGEGAAALVYIIAGEIIARTTPYPTYVAPTLGMSGSEPPDPWESWYTQILEASAAAVQSAANASDSEANASDSARRAELAETQAVNARNLARDAQTAAETAQGKAEAAQTAAETAQGKAEDAQTAAEDAQEAAETAQGKAEDAQTAAETAQGKAEDAQTAAEAAASSVSASAAILAEWQAHRYDPYATETLDGGAIFTALGADDIPVKSMTVRASSTGDYTLRRCGQNLLNQGAQIQTFTTGGTTRYGYQLYLPAGFYFLSWNRFAQGTLEFSARTADADGVAVSRISREGSETTFSTVNLMATGNERIKIEITEGDVIQVYSRGSTLNDATLQWSRIHVMVEVGYDAPTTAQFPVSAWSAYNATDYTFTIETADTPTAVNGVVTALGDNTFYAFKTSDPTALADTVAATLRLDPTLVYVSVRGA